MGLFGKLFGGETKEVKTEPVTTQEPKKVGSSIKLSKGSTINLSKHSTLEHVRFSGGWEPNEDYGGENYDLDLMCLIKSNDGHKKILYYADKHYQGISLDHDNLTGEGIGDDENIDIFFNKLPEDVISIDMFIIIYNARMRRQSFNRVDDAYIRITDVYTNKEICRYDVTKDGGSNTSLHAGSFYKENGEWVFKAVGEYGKLEGKDLKTL